MLVVAAGLGIGALSATAQSTPAPPSAVEPSRPSAKGFILLEMTFAADGKVAACHVVRSNAPFGLEASTVEYIKRRWVHEWLAGQTTIFPITFDELPSYATHWIEGLEPPPNFLPTGDPGRTLKLRVTFDANGWVEGEQLIDSTGIKLVDQQTAYWVKVHWHDAALAGKTVDVPLELQPPIAPKAPVAKAVPPPKPKPEPAPPAEPAAPPAVRVE